MHGRDFVDRWVEGLPQDDETEAVLNLDLAFYAKYNPSFIEAIPSQMRSAVLSNYHACGIYPYNERDFESFGKVRQLLSRHHAP
jgi:hypothetical protein